MTPVEHIPDGDAIFRLVDFPRMYDGAGDLLWENVFQFPGGKPESVVWSRYAPAADEVHRIGCAREEAVRRRNPGMRYVGFLPSTAGAVRSIGTRAGHGFSVVHEPAEGMYHAHIHYRPNNGRPANQLNRGEKNELKLALRQVFLGLQPHSCA